jgi:hypothetical protein
MNRESPAAAQTTAAARLAHGTQKMINARAPLLTAQL